MLKQIVWGENTATAEWEKEEVILAGKQPERQKKEGEQGQKTAGGQDTRMTTLHQRRGLVDMFKGRVEKGQA